jgi:2-oxoglutarate ferredoxin oxidoreductase subunit beta
MILESVRRGFISLIKSGLRKEDFVIVAGIGCHGKIFDYLNLSGFYGLHGRPIPVAEGIKIGNPNLNVVVFSGDGDTYSEGMEHFIHACRYNSDITLVVHDNQSFSLTTGQATPTSQIGFKTKAEPQGEANFPLNPLHLALSAGATFVARCNARDIEHTSKIFQEAVKHRGFSFVEIMQDCIIFNTEVNNRDSRIYKLEEKKRTLEEAFNLSKEYDYNSKDSKIPIGIFYRVQKPSLLDKWPILQELQKKKVGWKGFKR